ncbi:hypothetical protein HKX48_006137 [Thoreauomyces humboldtii]|nr:hypothetical protein HKX48_006137 [Thoreauomyces humboldtii]
MSAIEQPPPHYVEEKGNFMSEDEARLAKLGYKQGMKRQFTAFQNFGFVLTNASVLIGIVPLFGFGMATGGPLALTWGWLLVSCFVMCIGLGMAEICSSTCRSQAEKGRGGRETFNLARSAGLGDGNLETARSAVILQVQVQETARSAGLLGRSRTDPLDRARRGHPAAYPTAGGLYYWTAKLAGPRWGPLFSWVEAWFNALGQVAGASGSVLAAAQLLAEIVRLSNGHVMDNKAVFGVFCAMIVTGALMNTAGGLALKATSYASVYIHILGTIVIVITILATCSNKNSASMVFTQFEDDTGATSDGFSPVLVFMLGLLPSQWSLLGYDSSAHMSEETEASYVNGPRAIVYTIIAAVLMGFALILGMTFTLGDLDTAITAYNGGSNMASYVFVRNAGTGGGIFLLLIVVAAGWCCGIGTLAANSRMFYAFARDGGLPASPFWAHLDARSEMPIRLVWLSALLATILAIPSMFSVAALSAVSGISIIGFMVSYSIPILLRNTMARNTFVQSEFNLGRWSAPIGFVGCAWTACACVLFQFPQTAYPVTPEFLNYTPVAVGFMILFTGGWWLIDARKWFKGPRGQLPVDSDHTVVEGVDRPSMGKL